MIIQGHSWIYGDDIDTDRIIPARYLNTFDPQELAEHALEDLDPTFTQRFSAGDILVVGKNFGCGSSREHAPLALKGVKVGAIVAESFARIFYRNAVNIGLPILESPEAVAATEAGDEIAIDLDRGEIRNLTRDRSFTTQPFPAFLQEIIRRGGLVELVRQGPELWGKRGS